MLWGFDRSVLLLYSSSRTSSPRSDLIARPHGAARALYSSSQVQSCAYV